MLANTLLVTILQYISVTNQHAVHLSFHKVMSVISQESWGRGQLMQMQKNGETVVPIIYQKENIGPWKICLLQNTYLFNFLFYNGVWLINHNTY